MRTRHFRSVIVLGSLALALVLGACTGGDDGAGVRTDAGQSDAGQGFVSGEGGAEFFSQGDRIDAPEISAATNQGETLSLADLEGDVVVINVWASWCGPCRAEAPALEEVYRESKKRGVRFVGINTQDDEEAAAAFERSFDISYPSWVDRDGVLQLEFREVAPSVYLPSTIVVDRQGQVAARILGPTTYSQLSDLVDQVASEA